MAADRRCAAVRATAKRDRLAAQGTDAVHAGREALAPQAGALVVMVARDVSGFVVAVVAMVRAGRFTARLLTGPASIPDHRQAMDA
jgi:hypothetical protein